MVHKENMNLGLGLCWEAYVSLTVGHTGRKVHPSTYQDYYTGILFSIKINITGNPVWMYRKCERVNEKHITSGGYSFAHSLIVEQNFHLADFC